MSVLLPPVDAHGRAHWYNESTTITVDHRHTGALNNSGKMNISEKHKIFEEIG